jgi:hypothetical protein
MQVVSLLSSGVRSRLLRTLFFGCVIVLSACGSAPATDAFIVQVYSPTSTPVVAIGQGVPLPSPSRTDVNADPAATSSLGSAALESCRLATLPSNEHISSSGSYTQTEDEAAGPMMCQIQRNSCAFGLLVTDQDPNVAFSTHKAAPYTDEDRQMHPAMLMPLSRLSQLVQQEWHGAVNLYVTAAYDSLGEHDLNQPDMKRKYALHFEGRSLDLITTPSDQSHLDRLCALAYCAGFDWVHNEGDHCHVSMNAPSLCTYCSGSVPTALPTPGSQ